MIEFTQEEKDAVDTALQVIESVQEDIQRGKMAGFDLTRQEADLSTKKDQLIKIKQAFFQGG